MADKATTPDTKTDEKVVPVTDMPNVENESVKPIGDHVTVGTENLPGPREVEVVVSDSYVTPQIKASNSGDAVTEMSVTVDEVVTDPLGPLGVQVPDEGMGSLELPMHALAKGTVDQQLARSEKKS